MSFVTGALATPAHLRSLAVAPVMPAVQDARPAPLAVVAPVGTAPARLTPLQASGVVGVDVHGVVMVAGAQGMGGEGRRGVLGAGWPAWLILIGCGGDLEGPAAGAAATPLAGPQAP